MPLFLFHMEDGTGMPSEPVELADVDAARDMALRYVGQHLQDHGRDFWGRGQWQLAVTDGSNLNLFAIHVVALEAPNVEISVIPNPAG
jgi:hypothetical protein